MNKIYKFNLEPSKNNLYTVSAELNNKKFYIHSKYNPQAEAEQLAKKFSLDKYDFVIILGIGLGYIFNFIKNNNIFGVEKFNEIFEFYKKINFNPNITVFVNKKISDIVDSIVEKFDIKKIKNFTIVEIPSIVKLDTEYYSKLKKELITALDKKINSQITFEKLYISYTNNFAKNHKRTDRLFRIKNNREKYHLIISAGPSLEKDIPAIRKSRDKFVIHSVDTAYRYLLKNNITPDYVFSIDPQFYSYLHFYNIKQFPDTKFILDVFSFFKLYDILKNKEFIITKNIHSTEIFPAEKLLDFKGGSVTNFIFDVLLKEQIRKIIFSGLDLAYKDLKMYITYNYLCDYFLKRNTRTETLQTFYTELYLSRAKIKINSRIKTSHAMNDYKKYLQDKINSSNVDVFISKNSIAEFNNVKVVDLEEI